MSQERRQNHNQKHDWGESPIISHLLVVNFDRIREIRDFARQQEELQIFRKLLISPLVISNIPDDIIKSLKIDITHPKTDEEDLVPTEPVLFGVRENLINEFGHEVVRRINISLSNGTEI
ncbi:MAG: hypothetical protein ACD_13C00052G0032 [uncultured bacterium]|uniref:Uncharacterized protein n=1 Tax=Candidatus Woesebacteria bacterium GW2011_GWA1_40_43 TaxID=1618553 RepID=A0A0G0SEL3_9BACT|nr:MAG: hypothetical protein ACD_13C00052G0032 [uncultured bacterium]KKR54289.1 MAG: hypothetical protein UT88_C0001G0042 [Candidatus Woesebacteria bacterium GW2011_GWD2_40_19]KKR56696.1 MAG: hypothetical protein UT96_C0036G0004 [Candidatus Woesebacteria bacterium GW2011_GWC2_40_30]KKR63274.1 MAG: hypothetical protein UU02_C0028G0016 [Candidatus Woesebacteria bacterium GW2011_GWA1_40_43]HAU65596.1 hypothetical protein [Candidatus Woesebacteria bacterium]